jgi:hypothetical protein
LPYFSKKLQNLERERKMKKNGPKKAKMAGVELMPCAYGSTILALFRRF